MNIKLNNALSLHFFKHLDNYKPQWLKNLRNYRIYKL